MGSGVVIILAVVYMLLPQMVTLFFGAEWLESAEVIRRLYPYLVFVPFCGTLCFLPDVFAKQKIAMWMETGYVIVTAVVLALSARMCSFLPAVSAYALVEFGYLSIQLIWFISLIRSYQRTL